MSDQQHRPLSSGVQQIGDQRVSRRGVEVLAGLVDHQHRKVREQRAGQREPLPLSARDLRALGADPRGEPGGKPIGPVQQRGALAARRVSSAGVASRRARRMFSSSVVSKMWASWETSPITRR